MGAVQFAQAAKPAPAAPSPQQEQAYANATDVERVKLLIMLAKTGNADLAETMLHRYPLEGKYAANRTLYIEGLILSARRDYTGAVEKYRTALADDPKLTLVRSELAQTLVVLGEDDSAKHHLELLEADAPSEQDAAGIRAFIDQVDAKRPYKINAYISAAPSTNVNNGSRHATVYVPAFGSDFKIDDQSRKTSGIGVATGFNAGYSKRLGNDFSFVAAANGEARVYTDKDFNAYSLSQSVELRYLMQRGYLGLGAVASESLKNDEIGLGYYSYGPRASFSVNVSPRDELFTSVVHEWRDYVDSATSDGTALMVDAAWTHAFNSSFNVTLSGGYDRIKTQVDMNSYHTWSGGLSVYKELPKGITATLSGEVRASDFDAMNFMAGKTRKDTRLIGSIALTKRDLDLFGFAPSLEYTYTDNLSNISLFDYDSHAVDFRLTKDF